MNQNILCNVNNDKMPVDITAHAIEQGWLCFNNKTEVK